MNLEHFSDQYRLERRSYQQHPNEMKPHGLWVSVDGGWPDWCRENDYGDPHRLHVHTLTLVQDHNVLILTDAAGIDQFTARFANDSFFGIDWVKVAETYDGLIIAPYVWSRRLEPGTRWYYGWDCASGCIWNLTALGL